jgi:hypothetical protein
LTRFNARNAEGPKAVPITAAGARRTRWSHSESRANLSLRLNSRSTYARTTARDSWPEGCAAGWLCSRSEDPAYRTGIALGEWLLRELQLGTLRIQLVNPMLLRVISPLCPIPLRARHHVRHIVVVNLSKNVVRNPESIECPMIVKLKLALTTCPRR